MQLCWGFARLGAGSLCHNLELNSIGHATESEARWKFAGASICAYCNVLEHSEKLGCSQGLAAAESNAQALQRKVAEGQERLRQLHAQEEAVGRRIKVTPLPF